MILGVISDTHGLLRPEAVRALEGVDLIVHAGDVGDSAILDSLAAIAPVSAVRGNNDRGAWALSLPRAAWLEVEGVVVYAIHDVNDLDVDARAAGVQLVIAGHSHKPAVLAKDGVTFLNPGSAGPRRFKLPVSLARVRIEGAKFEVEIVALSGSASNQANQSFA